MVTNDYKQIFVKEFAEYGELLLRRQQIEFEIAQKHQFLRATLNMLPEEDRAAFEAQFSQLAGEALGLTDAIRKALQSNHKKAYTATEVRNKLREFKFDFSRYKSNELASVHSVLKRLKPEEVDVTEIDGVMAWRWVGPIPNPATLNDMAKSFDSLRVALANSPLKALSIPAIDMPANPVTVNTSTSALRRRIRANRAKHGAPPVKEGT